MRRTKRIRIETERFLILRQKAKDLSRAGWCIGCGAKQQMITPSEAAQLAHLSERTIFQLIESGALHFGEYEEGYVLVCLSSLLKRSNSQ